MNKKQKTLIFLIVVSTILFTSTTAIGNNVSNNLKIQNAGGLSIYPSSGLDMNGLRGESTLNTAPGFKLTLWSYSSGDYIDYIISIGPDPQYDDDEEDQSKYCNWKIDDNKYSGHLEIDEYLNPDVEKHFPIVSSLPDKIGEKVYGTITVTASGRLDGSDFQDTLSIDVEVTVVKGRSKAFTNSPFLSMLHGQFPRLATLFDFLSMLHR